MFPSFTKEDFYSFLRKGHYLNLEITYEKEYKYLFTNSFGVCCYFIKASSRNWKVTGNQYLPLYIGKTGSSFYHRFSQHRSSSKKENANFTSRFDLRKRVDLHSEDLLIFGTLFLFREKTLENLSATDYLEIYFIELIRPAYNSMFLSNNPPTEVKPLE